MSWLLERSLTKTFFLV